MPINPSGNFVYNGRIIQKPMESKEDLAKKFASKLANYIDHELQYNRDLSNLSSKKFRCTIKLDNDRLVPNLDQELEILISDLLHNVYLEAGWKEFKMLVQEAPYSFREPQKYLTFYLTRE